MSQQRSQYAHQPTPLASRRDPEITRLRQQLDGSERMREKYVNDVADRDSTIRLLRLRVAALERQTAPGRIKWYTAVAATLIVAWERLGRSWVSLLGDDRHERWTVRLAALVGAVAFFAAVFLGGGR